MSSKSEIVLSASRLEKFLSCSWAYYCSYILKMPESVHPKTRIGSLVHLILEWLCIPKHKKHLNIIKATRDVHSSKAISKYIEFFKHKYNIEDSLITDVNDLVMRALDHDFDFNGAIRIYEPEFEFKIKIDDNIYIKGYIDRLAESENLFKIRDYKTAGQKPTKKKMEYNIQALMYQLAIYELYNKHSEVEFNYLRHPKPLMCVEPQPVEVLLGFKDYLRGVAKKVALIKTSETATSNFLAETEQYHCNNFCAFRYPSIYYIALDKERKILASSKKIEELYDIVGCVSVEKKSYDGCRYFYGQN